MSQLREELQAYFSGSYELGRELTGGGMSRVFVAEDSTLGRRVVIKVLAPDLAAGLNAERFRREINLAAHLQHPHIVPVLSAGTAGTLPYFVMPFVDGESLRSRLLGEQGIPVNEAVGIMRDVAKALGFAHSHGVVHRDVKPDNVLLAGGSAVVTDFGIAKAISSSRITAPGETLTQAGTSLGTPAYMSPEQAAGDPNADARSDFYSFGVMCYEMLSGRPPFYDRPTHSLIMAHIAEPPEPIERQIPGIPPSLAALVMRCLAKRPEDRPQSAREILDALDGVETTGQRERTRTGETAPHAYRDGTVLVSAADRAAADRPRKRARIAWITAAAAAAIAIAVFAASRLMKSRTSQPLDSNSLAVMPFRVASADPSLHYLREGMVDLIAAKLSGDELRAVDPRGMLDAWQRAGGSATNDLSRDATLQLARELGAARALLGDVVGTPNRLVLNLSLLDVKNGNQVARMSVDGPPDSLASLVDRIATRLLTETSTEAATRLPGLTGTSLPALRAYLDGQSKLRRGEAVAAAKDFNRALEEDSTFALAGLGAWLAAGWYGDPQLSDRAIRLAWQNRQKLSDRDKAMLLALAGPHYPAPSTAAELYREREQYVVIARDNAEATYLLADHLFHFGSVLGIPDWEERALNGFRRAMELDSTYLPGYIHALPLAASMGDSAFARKATRLLLSADTSAFRRFQAEWYVAARSGNDARANEIWNRMPTTGAEGILSNVVRTTLFDGTGPAYAKRAVEQLVSLSRTEPERRGRARYAHEVMLTLGRPNEALRYLDISSDSARDINVPILKLRAATMGEVDRSIGDAAARELRRFDLAPEPTDSAGRATQRATFRVTEPWRLLNGDTSQTRRSIARLRTILPTVQPRERVAAQLEIGLIEAMYADVTRSPSLRQVLERVDSTMMQLEFGATHPGRLAQTAVTLARIWEKIGDEKRALAVVMRHPEWNSESLPYLGVQLREEARIAARAGEQKRARRSADHFIRLRALAEPSKRAQVDSVRREVGVR